MFLAQTITAKGLVTSLFLNQRGIVVDGSYHNFLGSPLNKNLYRTKTKRSKDEAFSNFFIVEYGQEIHIVAGNNKIKPLIFVDKGEGFFSSFKIAFFSPNKLLYLTPVFGQKAKYFNHILTIAQALFAFCRFSANIHKTRAVFLCLCFLEYKKAWVCKKELR
jgi:hypothetical protein